MGMIFFSSYNLGYELVPSLPTVRDDQTLWLSYMSDMKEELKLLQARVTEMSESNMLKRRQLGKSKKSS